MSALSTAVVEPCRFCWKTADCKPGSTCCPDCLHARNHSTAVDAMKERLKSARVVRDAMLAALETTRGNIRSLGPAGALPEPYLPWLAVVDDAIAKAQP